MLSPKQVLPVGLGLEQPPEPEESKQLGLGGVTGAEEHARRSKQRAATARNWKATPEWKEASKTHAAPTLQNLVHGIRPSGLTLGPKGKVTLLLD